MSQSIRSDHISESTIARIAGNVLSGRRPIYNPTSVLSDDDKAAVRWAVEMARAIAHEVRRTQERQAG